MRLSSLALPPTVATPLRGIFPRYQRLAVIAMLLAVSWQLGASPSRRLVITIYGLIGLGLLVRKPTMGLVGLFVAAAFLPFEVSTGTGSGVNVAMLGVLGLAVLWVIRRTTSRNLQLRSSLANGPWVALIVTSGVSILAGGALWDPLVSVGSNFLVVQLGQWSMFVLAALAFWLGANAVDERRQLERLTYVMLGLGVVFILWQLRWLPAPLNRVFVLNETLSRVWFVALAGGLALFDVRRDIRIRAAAMGFAVAIVVAGYSAGSGWAAGWLPQLVTLGTLVALRLGTISIRAGIIAAVPALIFATQLLPRLVSAERWSFETRLIAWRGLVQLVGNRWLFGMGLATYWHAWRDIFGSFSYLDPETGIFHFTLDPQVNMHNNYVDIYGQVGLIGLAALLWLLAALSVQAWKTWRAEEPGFGAAYAAACLSALAGMVIAAMLGDWIIPFVYNVGLAGFREAGLAWLLLGGMVVLDHTRPSA